ncbi:MAG TPA: EamA family transporter, partial [Candidatus Limnocylindrales bacterium]|nr:EamA family transporter [Candidatus Limnocylindrales bacterium]
IALVAGFLTALCWTGTTLTSARASRLIGASSTLAIVMATGLVVTLPFALAAPPPPAALTPATVATLVVAGVANVLGLLFLYRGYREGLVAIVSAISSTEGAIAAVIAILLGEAVAPTVGIALALVVVGVVLAAFAGVDPSEHPIEGGSQGRALAYAAGAAITFGIGLYAVGAAANELPIAWAVLPARVVGVLFVTLPLVASRRLRVTRVALPWAVADGIFEVAGLAIFSVGARDAIAVTSVLATQFVAITALVAWFLFHERPTRLQTVGVGTVVVGVAVLSALRAAG